MNTQSSAMHQSPLGSQGIAPAAMSAAQPFYWSIRRELWENRFLYIAPLAVAAVFLFGYLISMVGLPHKFLAISMLDPTRQREAIAKPYDFAAGLLMATQILVGVFYSLEALHGERRDRSILFWKSMPVSDLTTVLSKASIPIVIVPLLTFAVTFATQVTMLLLSSVVLLGNGQSVSMLWTQLSLLQMSAMLLYHLVTVHSLWHAPIYGWLLLVSGWARRAAFLWALLPPLAICIVEKVVFNSSHFAAFLGHRLSGGPEAMPLADPGSFPIDPWVHVTPGAFLTSPGLWFGLAVTAVFLAAAVQLRRNREPI
jgi:ABC-2 type transport system permease protein